MKCVAILHGKSSGKRVVLMSIVGRKKRGFENGQFSTIGGHFLSLLVHNFLLIFHGSKLSSFTNLGLRKIPEMPWPEKTDFTFGHCSGQYG